MTRQVNSAGATTTERTAGSAMLQTAHPTALISDIDSACSRIAPAWPLDKLTAVNPFWPLTDRPIREVAAELRALSGARLLMPRAWFRKLYGEDQYGDEELELAIQRSNTQFTLADLKHRLTSEDPEVPMRPRVADLVDDERDLRHEVSWREFITNSVSQFCASYFDDGQAALGPDREGGLYATWRRQAIVDKSPALLMGLRSYHQLAAALPNTPDELFRAALDDLHVPAADRASYLSMLLLDSNGWASWCMYRRWTARLAGEDDNTIRELIAVRLAWEWTLLRAGEDRMVTRWQAAIAKWSEVDSRAANAQEADWLFQEALELAWQRRFAASLPSQLSIEPPAGVAVQAAFCIDVRSEPYRRALEGESDEIQTIGFAGFFGMPIEYQPLGSPAAQPQLPALLAPRMRATDTQLGKDVLRQRGANLRVRDAWSSLKTGALSTFTFVESMGLTYAWKLLRDSLPQGVASRGALEAGLDATALEARKPRLTESVDGRPLDVDERCDLAAGVLRAMSLTRGFARLVVLAGHGSDTRNNPHAAGLDCGACNGQSGEVNARAAAALLNDPEIRAGLATRGIAVPERTRFLAGLHNTTTDDVELFDLDELPESHAPDLARLRQWLDAASRSARRQRAAQLGVPSLTQDIDALVRERARHWAQVRPEWGLANNAAFLVAPRERSKCLDLEGRCFLHDYRWENDEGFEILELIMTAPMVVTHWINFQYYASTVDNVRYGSGNKVLHNVVGGHIGVFEGNGGDLRIGLAQQSLHDGERWRHTPQRLSVFLEAPRDAIEAVLHKHPHVRQLVNNGWLDLFQFGAGDPHVSSYRGSAERQWEPLEDSHAETLLRLVDA